MEQIQTLKYSRISLIFVALLVLLFWGFYRTYLMFFPAFEGFQFAQHFHGGVMLLWISCLIAQPLLIANKKFKAHKAIGKLSYFIAPLLLISIFMVSKMAYHRSLDSAVPAQEAIAVIALSIPSLVGFAIIYSLAILNRGTMFNHMRYMIGTALLMIGPGLGRALIIYFEVPFPTAVSATHYFVLAIATSLLILDLISKRYFLPYLIIWIILLTEHLVWEFRYSEAWQAFGKYFASIFF
jgi:hypothetical protein